MLCNNSNVDVAVLSDRNVIQRRLGRNEIYKDVSIE
jgi:hypothetical protein